MPVVLFDGVCNLCNSSVNWIIDHDKKNVFRFASLQSDYGKGVVEKLKLHGNYMDTVVMVEDERAWMRSDAVLQILNRLGGLYSFAMVFYIVPRIIRDAIYKYVAANRYKWYGKRDSCRIPTPALKSKFIE